MKTVTPTRELEQRLWSLGHAMVAGVDEVGRGPLAGPVTVAAVVVPPGVEWSDVRDSKRLSPPRRQQLVRLIRSQATAVGIGWASCGYIDQHGLTAAMRWAGEQALAMLPPVSAVILDGNHNYLGDNWPVLTAVAADRQSTAVAAASIIAKVARDNYMEVLERRYPGYGFDAHKGYGSAQHLEALRRLGPCNEHRQTWRPVREAARVHG